MMTIRELNLFEALELALIAKHCRQDPDMAAWLIGKTKLLYAQWRKEVEAQGEEMCAESPGESKLM